MFKHRLKKTITCMLVFCLLLSCVPGGVFVRAEEADAETGADAVVTPGTDSAAAFQLDADCQILQYVGEAVFNAGNHVARLKDQETLDTYVFLNADGTRTVYYMDENVKFRDENGVIREKDVSLTATAQGYTTARNNVNLSLPTDLAQGVTLSFSGYDVTLIPENISAATTVQQQDGKIAYLNCYGKGTGLIYTPTLSGVKEDILLTMYTGVNSFTFLLNTDGLNMYRNEQGRYYLAAAENAVTRMEMADIVAYDANTRFSLGTMTVTPITAGQQYRLTVTVDEEFLTAETTAYPVLIDPSITVRETDAQNAIEDIGVYENKPNLNAGTWIYSHVGYYDDNYGRAQTVIRLTGLLNNTTYQSVTADQIQSAHFFLTEASGSAYEMVYLHPQNTTSNWDESTATWSKVGYYDNDWYREASMGYCETESFDITELVQRWKEGRYDSGWCGFILVSEWQSTMKKTLYTSEHSTEARRPYVVVEYAEAITPEQEPEPEPDPTISLDVTSTSVLVGNSVTLTATTNSDAPTWTSSNTEIATVNSAGEVTGVHAGVTTITATVSGVSATCTMRVLLQDGVYTLRNVASSNNMGAKDGSIADNTRTVLQATFTTTPAKLRQQWKITYIGGDYYTIRPLHKLSMGLYAFSPFALIREIGETDSQSAVPSYAQWRIFFSNNGYVFQNRYYSNTVIMPNNGDTSANTEMYLSAFSSGNNSQLW